MNEARACGDCSLCCRLLRIDEISKPKYQWCGFCKPGHGGCLIHASKPQQCKQYACLWLMGVDIPKPNKSGCVIDVVDPAEWANSIRVMVDDRRPTAWREGKVKEFLDRMVRNGVIVWIHVGTKRRHVMCPINRQEEVFGRVVDPLSNTIAQDVKPMPGHEHEWKD